MKAFIVLAVVVACAYAAPQIVYTSPLAVGAPVVSTVVAAPAVTASQYHAQDELGQYSYGYAGGPSAKAEAKTFDGVTRGGYQYVDANGLVQSVNYVADPVNGFRVAATNLPVAPAPGLAVVPGPIPQQVADTPEVTAAKVAFQARWNNEAAAAAAAPDV